MNAKILCAIVGLASLPACLDSEVNLPDPCSRLPTGMPAVSGDTVTTNTGLRYIVIEEGTGAVAAAGDSISVHYTGYLTDERKFDSSRDRGEPLSFTLGEVDLIKGFEQGVTGIQVGEQRRLIIPPALGYGSQPNGCIPSNSTLIFDVELLEVIEDGSE
jgi:FKBP-type peptidyl-prolyl cis-trans isomerase